MVPPNACPNPHYTAVELAASQMSRRVPVASSLCRSAKRQRSICPTMSQAALTASRACEVTRVTSPSSNEDVRGGMMGASDGSNVEKTASRNDGTGDLLFFSLPQHNNLITDTL